MASSSWHGVNFVIGIIALLLVVIIYIIVFEHRTRFESFGTGWNVFLSTDLIVDSDQNGDVIAFPTDGHNLLIVNRNVPTTVRLLQDDSNHTGLEVGIKNNGTQNVTLTGSDQSGDVVSFPSNQGTTITTDNSNLQNGTTTIPPGQGLNLVFVQNRFVITSSDPMLRSIGPTRLRPIQSPPS